MTLHLLQHGLRDLHSHYWNETLGWLGMAAALGEPCIVHAHQKIAVCPKRDDIIPAFRSGPLSIRERDPSLRNLADYLELSEEFAADCRRALLGRVQASDTVLVPYASDREMLGAARWLETTESHLRPHTAFIFHHGGLAWKVGVDRRSVAGDFTYWVYAARRLARAASGRSLVLSSPDPKLARMLGGMLSLSVRELPWMQSELAMKGPLAPEFERRDVDLGVLGEFRPEHGSRELPALLIEAARRHPDHRMMLQVRDASQGESIRSDLARHGLERRIEVVLGDLSHEDFYARLSRCRLLLLAYRPERYRLRTSGMLCDAIALGVPVLVPSGTGLSDQVDAGAASGMVYDDLVAGLLPALSAPTEARAAMVSRARSLAVAWRARNAPKRVLQEILAARSPADRAGVGVVG